MDRPKREIKEKKTIIFTSPKNNIKSEPSQQIPKNKQKKRAQDKFNKALSKFNQSNNFQAHSLFLKVIRMAKKIHDKTMLKESHYYLKKIEEIVDAKYRDEIAEYINEIKNMKNDLNLSDLKSRFKKMMTITDRMYNSNTRETEIKRLKDFQHEIKISKIKETILNLGKSYSRLYVKEIAEECKIEDEQFIVNVINDMIANEEINARFFKSTFSVAFNQDVNVQNFSDRKDMVVSGSITQIKEKCIVCKGDIQHLIYQCSKCQASYHVKCANLLRKDGKNCFQCNEPIPPLPE